MQTSSTHFASIKKLMVLAAALVALSFAMLTQGTASAHQAMTPFASGGGCNVVASTTSAPVKFNVCVSENRAQQIVSSTNPLPFGTPSLYGACTLTVNLVDTTAGHTYFGIGQNCTFAMQNGGGNFSGPLPPAITGHHYHTHVTFQLVYNGETFTDDHPDDLNSPTQIA